MFILLAPVTAPPVNGHSRMDEFRYPGWIDWLLEGHDMPWHPGMESYCDFHGDGRLVK